MTTLFPSVEPTTWYRIAIAAATIAALAFIAPIARKKRTWRWTAINWISISYGALALSTLLAGRMFVSVMDDVSQHGGGIGAISHGIWQSAQLPLAAAWMAVLISAAAGFFCLRGGAASRRSAWSSGVFVTLAACVAFALGLAPVVLLRRAMEFVIYVITPGAHRGPQGINDAIAARLASASGIAAACFVALLVLAFVTLEISRRSQSEPGMTLTAVLLVVSISLSAFVAFNLQSMSSRYREIALHGHATPVSALR